MSEIQHGIGANDPKLERFDGSYFHLWKIQLISVFMHKELWGVVNGEVPKPEESERSAYKLWVKRDNEAKAIITLSMERKLVLHISKCNTSEEMFKKLEKVYQAKNRANLMQVKSKLAYFKMKEGSTMEEHISTLNDLVEQYEGLDAEVNEEEKIFTLLRSLPKKYAMLKTALQNQDNLDYDEICARLVQHDIQVNGPEIVEHEEKPKLAYFSKAMRERPQIKCFECGEVGHISRICPIKEYNTRHVSSCFVCGDHGHKAFQCKLRKGGPSNDDTDGKQSNFAKAVNLAVLEEKCEKTGVFERSDAWLIDSGASSHMCNKKEYFKSLISLEKAIEISLGDGTKVKTRFKGNVHMELLVKGERVSLILRDVLFVPELVRNIFSVRKAVKFGNSVWFGGNVCFVKNRKNEEIGVGILKSDLWELRCKVEVRLDSNLSDKMVKDRVPKSDLKLERVGEKKEPKTAQNVEKGAQKRSEMREQKEKAKVLRPSEVKGAREGRKEEEKSPKQEETQSEISKMKLKRDLWGYLGDFVGC